MTGAVLAYFLMKGRIDDTKKFYEENMETMRAQFKAAASEIAENNSKVFRENSAMQIDALLKPLRESLGRFDRSLNDTRAESIRYNAELKASIEMIVKQSAAVGEEAGKLADAITGQVKFQGNFGEMLLDRLLDSAGMRRGVHYEVQGRIRDMEGNAVKTEQGR